ncbi:MAG: hypothetical protein C0483_21760 [Pirellula sp.]|nr:hypothetical protein [Pirellula sp.]
MLLRSSDPDRRRPNGPKLRLEGHPPISGLFANCERAPSIFAPPHTLLCDSGVRYRARCRPTSPARHSTFAVARLFEERDWYIRGDVRGSSLARISAADVRTTIHDCDSTKRRESGMVIFDTKAHQPDDSQQRTIQLLLAAADGARDAIFVKDLAGRYLFCNAAAERFVGRTREELHGRDDLELFGETIAAAMQAHDRRVLASGIAEMEVRNVGSPGNERICEVTKSPYRDRDGAIIGVIGTAREVTESRRDRQKLLNRQAVLELIAQGAPPADILDGLVRLIEEEIPGVVASCMLLDAEGKHLHVAAGRGLATEYVDAIQGLMIGPNVGSCGAAAFRGETVIAEDIACDPLWDGCREAALRHELRACVSVPILSRKIKPTSVLGTFAVYSHRPGPPHPKLLSAIADVEHLACIAVESNQIMRKLQAEEARFRTFAENTSDAFLLHRRDGTVIDANSQASAQLGYTLEELNGMLPTDFDPAVTPEGLNQILKKLETGERLAFDSVHRRKDGTTFPVEVRLTPFYQGDELRTVAVVQDITARKEAERALRESERRHQLAAESLDAILNALPAQIALLDATGVIKKVNGAWRNFAAANALTLRDMGVGVNYVELARNAQGERSEEASAVARGISQVLAGELSEFRMEYPCDSPAEKAWYQMVVNPLIAGERSGAVVMHLDDSARKRAEAGRRLNAFALEHAAVEAYIVTADARILKVNQAACRNLGYSEAELLQLKVHDIDPDFPAQKWPVHWKRLRTERHIRFESRQRRKSGEFYPVEIEVNYLKFEGTEYNFAFVRDLTERKRAEAELHKTTALLRAVAEGTSDSLFVKDLDDKYLFVNQALARMAGKRMEDIIGKDDTTLFDPESARFLAARDRRIRETGAIETEEETLSSFGTTRTFLATKGPYRDERGNIIGTIGIATDITKRKRAEQAVRESEERYRALFESCGDAIFILTQAGRICSANPAASQMSGYSFAELAAMKISDLDSQADAELVPERMRRLKAGETLHFEVVHRRKDGTTYPVEVVATPLRIGGEEFVLAFDRDISIRKEAERSLRLTQFSIDRAVDSVFWISPVGEILYVNDAACRTLGYSQEELIGKTVPEIDPNFPAEAWPAHWEEIKRRGSFTFESQHGTKDGRMLQTEVTVNYLQHENREYNCAVMRDVTNRKQTERERDRLWNYSPDPLCVAGFDGKLRQVNPAWTKILGWSTEELLEQAWISLVHPDDREASLAAEQTLLRGEDLTGLENRYRCKNGEYRWFSWNAIPLPEQQTICAFVRDITRERTLAEQFRQAQKMEAIGRLAGGVAHDFNNLLTVINGYSSLLLGAIHDDARRKPLEVMLKAGQRAATLTSQLLAFSRKAIVDPQILDLNRVVESITGLLGRMIGEDVRLKLDLAPKLSHVAFDPGQLEQVLMNLAVNARDAMPDGGILTISTRAAESPSNDPKEPAELRPGRYVQLIVADEGLGMSDDVKARIFEPFFTTKGVGVGTGLGLATVYGAVQQAGGFITVESQLGHGATFRIWFPATSQSASDVDESRDFESAAGKETVLVVEDEQDVRGLVRFVLDMQGYQVLEADSGSAAVQVAAEFQGPIHLLLTDLVMNDLNGRELADLIRRSRPDVNVLFMSGYTEDDIVRRGIKDSRSAFLQKPFSPETLAEKVRQVLDAGPADGR